MLRIAVAGAGGFAQILVQQLCQTDHAVLVLTRQSHPEIEQYCPGAQIAIVDYDNLDCLRYTLRGIDLVISTISGSEQINLIDAARKARVRVFVPSEFEGDLSHRPAQDPLDRGSQSALELLEQWSQSKSYKMNYTIFSCGLFMERFAPGGLQAYQIGTGCGIQTPDDYLVNVESCQAEGILYGASGRSAHVSLTSVYDVAQFVVAAIELGIDSWPKEFRMRGDSMTVQDLVQTCAAVRGMPFGVITRTYDEVVAQAELCRTEGDLLRWLYYQRLLQTADGRYYVRNTNLMDAISRAGIKFQPLKFKTWLEQVWKGAT